MCQNGEAEIVSQSAAEKRHTFPPVILATLLTAMRWGGIDPIAAESMFPRIMEFMAEESEQPLEP